MYRCSNCGAPLDVSPDSVVVVCRYCGAPNFVAGGKGEVLAVPTLTSSEILKRAVERTRRDFNLGRRMRELSFASPELVYVPFYFVDVALSASYAAVVTVTYTRTVYVRGQPRTRLETRRVQVSGRVRLVEKVPVVARRAAWGKSLDRLAEHFLKTAPRAVVLADVAKDASTSAAFLAAEFDAERAKAKAVRAVLPELLSAVEEDAARKARIKVGVLAASAVVEDKAVDYEVEKVEASPITYLPMWIAPYVYRGSFYKYYVAGWDGSVVVAEEPAFVEHKVMSGLAAAAAAGFGGGVLAAGDVFVGALGAAAGAVLAYMASGGLLKSRRLESR
ncbi:MAG: zinc ribbon domain-containing protein [Pyrobaculum sp.]